MSDNTHNGTVEAHDRQVKAVMAVVVNFSGALSEKGYPAEAVFEGMTKGAIVSLLNATPATAADVSILLRDFAHALDHLDKPELTVVK